MINNPFQSAMATLPRSTQNSRRQSLDNTFDHHTDALQQIVTKLTELETGQRMIKNNIRTLNEENHTRRHEIKNLALATNSLVTEDDITPNEHHESEIRDASGEEDNKEQEDATRDVMRNRTATSATNLRRRVETLTGDESLSSAKEIIRTVESLNGSDDVGVHDFIKSVKRAKTRCRNPDLLLDYILTEKITGNAKRSIRHIPIDSYDDLYKALNTNLSITTSVELCRTKLDNVRQGSDSVQIFSQKFRGIYNELTYALQSNHTSGIERKLALKMEEKSAVKRYIMNLRDDISSQVRPMKPKTINEALQEALESEIWLKEKNKNYITRTTLHKKLHISLNNNLN